jgi:hypothetical protein
MNTEGLIAALTENLEPVRPLRQPWLRTGLWTAGATLYLVVLALVMSPRSDLGARMRDLPFLIEQAAALFTGIAAAAAAFGTVVPGHRRGTVRLAVVFAGTWIAIVGIGALREVRSIGLEVLLLQADWGCVRTVLIGAAVPGAAMAAMLRRGARLTPHLTAALGGLAAAGLGNLGICFFHPHSTSLVVLVWHCGTVVILAALAGIAGGQLLRWPQPRTLQSI